MSPYISDSKWASAAGFCLLGIAWLVMFVIRPGGFETAIGWFFLLRPSSLPAYAVSDRIYRLAPSVEPVIYWTLIISLSFGWYWTISYAVIKVFRAFWLRGRRHNS